MLKKTIIIFLITFIATMCLPNMIFAMDEVISSGDGFLQAADKKVIDEDALQGTSNYIYNILFTIAVVLAVAIGMIIGIQFIMGSVDEKAKIKETLVPYVIGVFIVFASFTIWKLVIELGNDVTEYTGYSTPPVEAKNPCPYCSEELGTIPNIYVTGGSDYTCKECGGIIPNEELHKYI